MPKSQAAGARSVLCIVTVVAVLAACTPMGGAEGGQDDPDGRPVIATTFTILADMARRIGGERVEVESITTPGADVHRYEPSTDDLRRVAGADMLISNGLGMDDWLLRFVDGTDATHVVASDGVDPLAIRAGNYTGLANPHAWMSPAEGQRYVRTIARALTDLDPVGADEYTARSEEYAAELEEMGAHARSVVSTLPRDRRILVTCEGAFSYLARDVGLEEFYMWPVNTEAQGVPRQTAALIDAVRDRSVPAVFCESTVSSASMEQVASDTGAALGATLYVDSLSAAGGPVPTYIDLLDHDLTAITEGLSS